MIEILGLRLSFDIWDYALSAVARKCAVRCVCVVLVHHTYVCKLCIALPASLSYHDEYKFGNCKFKSKV